VEVDLQRPDLGCGSCGHRAVVRGGFGKLLRPGSEKSIESEFVDTMIEVKARGMTTEMMLAMSRMNSKQPDSPRLRLFSF
jgi:hypothetical protein